MSELYLPFKHVESPVHLKELSKLDPRCKVIQFDTPLTEYDFLTLADFLKNNPQIGLRIYGYREFALEDLSFLRHFSFIKDFSVEVWKLKSFAGIEYLSDSVETLTIGTTERKKSVSFLANFSSLKKLYIEGVSVSKVDSFKTRKKKRVPVIIEFVRKQKGGTLK